LGIHKGTRRVRIDMADVLMTGGGTGGHLFPALAVASALQRLRPGCNVAFVGTPDRLEAQVVPEAGFPFFAIPARGFSRQPLQTLAALGVLGVAIVRAWRLLRQEAPRAVFGTGGYVSAPLMLAACAQGIPCLLHEQNVYPGKVNRALARFVTRFAISFASSRTHLRTTDTWVSGNPVRTEAFEREPAAMRDAFGFAPNARVLLVTGGSQGAATINRALLTLLPRIVEQTDWVVHHVCGLRQFDAIQRQTSGIDASRYRLDGFLSDMPAAIVAADLVVSRAGATTLAELTVAGKPMVLVPYPLAGGHQALNAQEMRQADAACVVPDAELETGALETHLWPLLVDADRRASMAEASRRLARPDAAEALATQLLMWLDGG
jgi:UDP-N-acetylglucosamine--N-acetylmuramyl-(pentapeptide) pyrophosphoryl-undecaprenol N-acetylglucosamine transferase